METWIVLVGALASVADPVGCVIRIGIRLALDARSGAGHTAGTMMGASLRWKASVPRSRLSKGVLAKSRVSAIAYIGVAAAAAVDHPLMEVVAVVAPFALGFEDAAASALRLLPCKMLLPCK